MHEGAVSTQEKQQMGGGEVMSFEESGHWYDHDGNSAHEVPDPEDPTKMVKTTLKHARLLDLSPSVTSVQQVQNAPGLNRWQNNRHALVGAGCSNLLDQLGEKAWLGMVRDRSSLIASEASIAGTQYHLVVESIVNNIPLPDYELTIHEDFFSGFLDWWYKINLQVQATEVGFCHPLGYGGRMDLVAMDSEECDVFVDWKTKDTEGKTKSRLFFKDSQPVQLAGYMEGYRDQVARDMLYLNKPKMLSVVISRDEPGRIEHKWWPEDKNEFYLDWFKSQLDLWKRLNNYDPSWE